MSINFTNAANAAMLNALVTYAGTGCKLKFCSGTQPTNADTAIGTVLVTDTISGALGTVSNSALTLGSITSGTATGSGTATYARLTKSDDTAILDLTVGTSGSDITVNSTAVNSGGIMQVSSATINLAYP